MSKLLKEVSMTLDAESHELARQLGNDLREMLQLEPSWAEKIKTDVEAMRTEKSPAWTTPLLGQFTILDAKIKALEVASQTTKELIGVLPERKDLNTAKDEIRSELNSRLESLAKSIDDRMVMLNDCIKGNQDGIRGILSGLSTVKEQMATVLNSFPQADQKLTGLAEQLAALRREMEIQKTLVEKLNRSWYQRLFGV